MKSSYTFVILFFCTVSCEWIEITPIVNKKLPTEVEQIVRITTPASDYEVFLTTPILKNEFSFTTPANNIVSSNEDVVFNNYSTHANEFMNKRKPPLITEEYSNLSWKYNGADLGTNSDITYEGFLPFLKMIQNNLFKYKNKSRKSKMSILKHLRDRLLFNIKERITHLWKPLEESSEARGYKDEDGHMDFPSNEGALMTIGFLTFAVFLIKLVIKLVHVLKHKQQYHGMATTTTASSVVYLKRKKRDEVDQEATKILQYIDEFELS